MKKWIRGIAIALAVVILAVLVKNEYGRFLLAHANYGMQALITGQQEGTLGASASTNENTQGNASELSEERGLPASGEKAGGQSKAAGRDGVNLYIGSSMFRKGLDIHELDQGVKGTNYILSYNGTRAFQCYEELRYALDKGVKIRHLYVDLYAFAMSVDPWVEDSRLFLETDLGFKIRLWRDMVPYSSAPLKDFWEMFVTANNDRLLTWAVDYGLTNRTFLRGGSLQEDPGNGVPEYTGTAEVPDVEPAEMNAAQTEYLVRLIQLCQEKDIPLTFIETPKYKSIMFEDSYVALMRAYLQVLNQYGVDYCIAEDSAETCAEQVKAAASSDSGPGPTAQDGSSSGPGPGFGSHVSVYTFDTANPTYFEDFIHLSSEGRREFTRIMTESIR